MSAKEPDWIENVVEEVRKHIKAGKYRITNHALERQEKHRITLPDLLHALSNGFHEEDKTIFDIKLQTWKYAIRGKAIDVKELRIIVAFEKEMAVITVIPINKRG